MSVQQGRYQPLFPSEQTVPKPWIGCGVCTDIVVTAWGTLGESQIRPNGRPYGKDDLTNQLKIGLRAFRKVADTNGIPDRDDAQRIHRAMFPGLPDLIPLVSRDFDEVVEVLREDKWAVSIAVNLAAMPAGLAITRYTRAAHQIPLVGAGKGATTAQDAMHPPRLTWGGHRVPLAQVEKAAKSFPGSDHGLVMAWKVPIGGWTQAALQTEGLRDRVGRLQKANGSLDEANDELERRIDQKNARIAELEAAPPGTDCTGPVAAAWESFGRQGIESLDVLRARGPK